MTLPRFRGAAIVLGAVVLVTAAVAAIVDLAGGPDILGGAGTLIWAVAMVFFGVVTARESDEAWLRRLGVITAVAAAVTIAATIAEGL
jgi:hypothetical protein